ncbi:TlpA family protein disulfide reductase [Flavilitoribacter nigricans]|nr:TlpA disulfide reductase family protein [Flavilitoribacter nigricans]
MRYTFVFLFLILNFLGNAQEASTSVALDHFAAPKVTRFQIKISETLAAPTRLLVMHKYVLDLPFKMDTLLPAGTRELQLDLPLENPSLITIRINNLTDQLFVVPGRNLTVAYSEKEDSRALKKEITNDPELNAINTYYQKRISISGTPTQPLAAYRAPFRTMTDFAAFTAYYDSLTQAQSQLLTDMQEQLLPWFVSYEANNIHYTGLSFQLYMMKMLRYDNPQSSGPESTELDLLAKVKLDDLPALPIVYYTEALKDLALLKYCTADCFGDSENKWRTYHAALLRLGQEITTPAVRELYFAGILMRSTVAGETLPPTILNAYQNGLSGDYLNRIAKHTPKLDGQPAPGFYLKELSGGFKGIADFKGKVVLLNFWFVGCKGCLAEIPYEQQLVEQFADAPFALVNICTKSSDAAWRKWVEEKGLHGVNLLAQGNWNDKIAKSYQILSYPTYVLIGKDGKVINGACPEPSSGELVGLISEHLE